VCPLCAQPLQPMDAANASPMAYCSSCEVARFESPPADRAFGAGAAGSAAEGSHGDVDPALLARTFRRKLRRLLRYGPVRDLLDVGCGSGALMQEALRLGIAEVIGLDPEPSAVAAARRSGLEAYQGSLEVLPPARQFDAIVMLDVLEFLPDPLTFLRNLRPHLRSGGHLFVMTPNIRSRLARLSSRRRVSFAPSDEVHYAFSPRSIHTALERAGFDPVWVRGTGHYVTLAFLFSGMAPAARTILGGTARLLRLDRRVVYAPNGSIDVVARAAR